MKKYYHVILMLLLSVSICRGQGNWRVATLEQIMADPNYSLYEGIYRGSPPWFTAWHINKAKQLDKAYIKVLYDADIRIDTLPDRRGKDRVLTLIGEKWISTTGYSFYQESMLNSFPSLPSESKQKFRIPSGYACIINWMVWRDVHKRNIINRFALPLMKDYSIGYEEKDPIFEWHMVESFEEICGYICQKAETFFCGRYWSVWFTPEIPVDGGFWKFTGLPGLVLKATDAEAFFSFVATGIEETNECIEDYRYPLVKTKTYTRSQCRKIEADYFISPLLYSNVFSEHYMLQPTIITRDTPKSLVLDKIYTAENYMNIHFPMEKE
ncbi:MAG: GLPGLI family protein [Bacteroidales bacterium]|nr:GLPGLI family protein [Bacteroidales bacterium]